MKNTNLKKATFLPKTKNHYYETKQPMHDGSGGKAARLHETETLLKGGVQPGTLK